MSKAKSGGGIRSNKVVSVGIKTGKPGRGVRPGDAAMIGIQRITTTGPSAPQGSAKAISVPLGNELTKGTTGPGGGRTIHGCGSQGRHGGGNVNE